ncbi:hypothetical protein BJY00DRAFT_315013 [Aspergillus carlsbadensis]|nr:hypothetical protein BJY00DRAFT_315013 [Aspergillus carlsbadensis]
MSSQQQSDPQPGKLRRPDTARTFDEIERRIREWGPPPAAKRKWHERLRERLSRRPRGALADEDYTLYVGKPNDEAWVKFRPGTGPYVLILHGNKSASCEWWYLGHEEIMRDPDPDRSAKVQSPELNVVYEYGKEGFACRDHVHRTKVGTVAPAQREAWDEICLAVGMLENGHLFVRHALNRAMLEGILQEGEVYETLVSLEMVKKKRNV